MARGAKYVIAFSVDYDLDERRYSPSAAYQYLAIRVWFNCAGDPMPADGPIGSSGHALDAPGAEWAYPKYACTTIFHRAEAPGMFIDRRSLHQMISGCCPTEIGNEMTGIWNVAD